MDEDIGRLIEKLRRLEDEIENKFEQKKKALQYRIENQKVIFEKDVLEQQRRLRVGMIAYLRATPLTHYASVPFVYGLLVPLLLLDISTFVFQRVCFSLWGLPRLHRSDYVSFDRRNLAHLNGIEKFNCLYCGYANGVIAVAREVASQTEQYWCPIKHAARMRGTHDRYRNFLEYGDAEGFHRKSNLYREKLRNSTISNP